MRTILQINSYANWGSTGKIMEQIGERILDHGWKSYISYGRKRMITPSKSHAIRIGNYFSVRVHGGISLFDCHGLGSEWETKRFVKRIQELSPDLIHLHNIHGYYLNYRVLFEYLARTDIPVVWTLHDCWPFTGHCSYFDLVGCERWKTECHHCPQRSEYPRSLFVDNSTRNYQLKKRLFTAITDRLTVVPVSEWLGNLVRESFLGRSNIQVIHNGIDIDTFAPAFETETLLRRYNLGNRTVILGVSSPWTVRKGLADFIRLRTELPQSDFAIVLVGLTRSQIDTLPSGIIGIERTQNARELAQWYSIASVFFNPTYEDNYPTVSLEAIACGTPVVTYCTGGSPEAVSPDTGAVVVRGDLLEAVNVIKALSDGNRSEFRRRCRDFAEGHFDKHLCFQTYLDLYRKLLHED